MKYWENGFFTEQNEQGSRIEISDNYYSELIEEQSTGKEIVSNENGLPVARERVVSIVDLNNNRKFELQQLLDNSDYIVTKLAELQIQNSNTYVSELARYQETLNNRSSWRSELDTLLNE